MSRKWSWWAQGMCILKIYFNFYVYVCFAYVHMCGMSVTTVPRGHLIIYTHLCCVCVHLSGISAHTALMCMHTCVWYVYACLSICVCVYTLVCVVGCGHGRHEAMCLLIKGKAPSCPSFAQWGEGSHSIILSSLLCSVVQLLLLSRVRRSPSPLKKTLHPYTLIPTIRPWKWRTYSSPGIPLFWVSRSRARLSSDQPSLAAFSSTMFCRFLHCVACSTSFLFMLK